MIKSVEIKNLRGIQEGKLDELTPLVVLVGPNGSGKSTILDALLIAGSPDTLSALGKSILRRPGVKHGAKWITYRKATLEGVMVTVKTPDEVFRTC